MPVDLLPHREYNKSGIIFQIEELYTSLVYLTQHQVGFDIANECELECRLSHLQSAFKVDDETHQQVLIETQNMEVIISIRFIDFDSFWSSNNRVSLFRPRRCV